MNTSVVSAAIIEGNLIIGLSDGSIINCGFVQGPQGLSGPQGPMGATGDNGTDGNTILTVGGTPGNEMGSDGDYAIDNINWRIYGPKAGGVWGKAKEMLPGPENILENGRAPSGGSGGGSMGGSGSGSGGGGIVYTNTVQLTNPTITLLRSSANYKIIPNAPTGATNQEDANLWGFGSCFDNFDAAIPVPTGTLPPNPLPGFIDNYDGRLWFNSNPDSLILHVYKNKEWVPTFPPITFVNLSPTPPVRPDRPDGPSDGDLWFDTSPDELTLYVYSEDSGAWIPAAPPTTLEGRVSENEALQIQIIQRLQANEALTSLYSRELLSIKDDFTAIQNDIIELEEEIDAIAPSVERGKWTFTAVGTVGQPGQFTMYDAEFGNGSPTGLFKSAKSIWFNEIDSDGTPHAFGDVDDGELLEIFIDGSPEYGLFEVIGKAHDETQGASSFWVVDVNFVRTNEATTAVGPGELCRFKIFMAPTGGDASSFVMKSGDTMTGDLDIDTSEKSDDNEAGLTLKGNRPSSTNSSATITFENEQSTEKGYITYRSDDGYAYFGFNQDLFLNHHALFSVNSITMWPNSGIGATSNTPLLTFHNRSTGNEGDGLLKVKRPADSNRRGFVIRGNDALGVEQDMLYTYTNATGTPDAINYVGKMDNAKNLVNKEYVDSKAGGVDISCETTGRSKGDMWYCSTDQVLYIKVS